MSRASKLTLALTSLGTAGVVYLVHWAQQRDLEALHAGVVRDLENQQRKKSQAQLERQADFETQARLEAEFRRIQPVTVTVTATREVREAGANAVATEA
ncbi:hypothetical protein KEM52_001024 [Ascosphaera acerosa]|nr:hypothetical protein KEM52_001024 [Ascosphaera acerosa]